MKILQRLDTGFRRIYYYMIGERKQVIKVTVRFNLLTSSGHVVKRESIVYDVEEEKHVYKFDSYDERWAVDEVIMRKLHDELHKDGRRILEEAKGEQIVEDRHSEYESEVIAGVDWSLAGHKTEDLSFEAWQKIKVSR